MVEDIPKKLIKLEDNNTDKELFVIPEVSYEEIIPRIKIYDHYGSYYFRRIGFNRKINDDGR